MASVTTYVTLLDDTTRCFALDRTLPFTLCDTIYSTLNLHCATCTACSQHERVEANIGVLFLDVFRSCMYIYTAKTFQCDLAQNDCTAAILLQKCMHVFTCETVYVQLIVLRSSAIELPH
eukprot:7545-Heterococcus_DN1.PRE.2